MAHTQYLLFFDKAPINHELIDYFAQLNIKIIHKNCLSSLDKEFKQPSALIIHWSLTKDLPHKINQLYHKYPVPLLVLNDNPDEELCISMLEAGADGFLTKPLYPRELHARIKAIQRRITKMQLTNTQKKNVILFGSLSLYPASRQVFDEHNNELQLSVGEYDLLYLFVQQPQCILDRDFLLKITKHREHNPYDRRIDVQISRLRQKIECNSKKPTLIKTVRNGGYMFTSPVISL